MTKDYGPSPETYAIPVQPVLDNLFSDILVHIFSFLHPTDIIAVRQVCGSHRCFIPYSLEFLVP
jgi:hypothetical protein